MPEGKKLCGLVYYGAGYWQPGGDLPWPCGSKKYGLGSTSLKKPPHSSTSGMEGAKMAETALPHPHPIAAQKQTTSPGDSEPYSPGADL